MDNLLVGNDVLADVVTHHLRLDLERNKLAPRVNMDRKTYHAGKYNHVSRMCFDRTLNLAVLCKTGFLDQFLFLVRDSSVQSSPLSRRKKLQERLKRHSLQLFQTASPV